jgi:hypothetical protein
MGKTPKTASEDLWFVRKYCFTRRYPANDGRCRHITVKILFKSSKISTDSRDFEDLDALFLCRYPDETMPLHEARPTSELDQCPNTERRQMIDAQQAGEA